jgi:anti-sigma28 factor (negative regulator of flagellin synthesis)
MIRKVESSILNNVSSIQNNKTKAKVEKLSKVEEIKKAIENGTYKIDIQKSAKAMAKALL